MTPVNIWGGQVGAAVVCGEPRGIDHRHGAVGQGLGHLDTDFIGEMAVGHGAQRRLRVKGVAEAKVLGDGYGLLDKCIVKGIDDIDPFDTAARLAGVEHGCIDQGDSRCIYVRIGHHVRRILATQFQANASKGPSRGPFDAAAALDRSGKIDEIEAARGDQRSGGVVIEKKIGKYIFRHSCLGKGAHHALAHQECLGWRA